MGKRLQTTACRFIGLLLLCAFLVLSFLVSVVRTKFGERHVQKWGKVKSVGYI